MSTAPSLSPEEKRVGKLVNEFLKLEGKLLARRRMPHYDKQSLFWLLLLLLSFVCAKAVVDQSWRSANLLAVLAYSATGVALAMLLWSLATDVDRFVRKKAYDLLAQDLLPLRPSMKELEEVMQMSRNQNLLVGQKIDLEKLCNALVKRGSYVGPGVRLHDN